MSEESRRRFLEGCATTAAATGVLASGTVFADETTDELPSHPPESTGGWSSYRGDYRNAGAVGSEDGFVDGSDFDGFDIDWVHGAEGLPVVDDGIVYVSDRGSVQAIDADDGSVVWQSTDVGAIDQPTVAYESVYVGGNGAVTALDAESGDVSWQTSIDDTSHAAPTVAFGMVYVVFEGGLYGIDAETGTIEWERESVTVPRDPSCEGCDGGTVELAIEHGTAAANEYVFTIADEGTVVGLNPLTGDRQLTIETDYLHLYDLTLTDEKVVVRSESEEVTTYDLSTGERDGIWNGGIRTVAVRENTLVFVTFDELVAIDLESGHRRWSVGQYFQAIGDPVIAGNSVLVSFDGTAGEYENSLVAFDLVDGHEQWVFSRAENATTKERCVVADRTVYIDDGSLTAIRTCVADGGDDGDDEGDGDDGDDEGDGDDGKDEDDRDSGNDGKDKDDGEKGDEGRDRSKKSKKQLKERRKSRKKRRESRKKRRKKRKKRRESRKKRRKKRRSKRGRKSKKRQIEWKPKKEPRKKL